MKKFLIIMFMNYKRKNRKKKIQWNKKKKSQQGQEE